MGVTDQIANEPGYEFYSYYVDPITTDGQCTAKGGYYPKSVLTKCQAFNTDKAGCIGDSDCTYN